MKKIAQKPITNPTPAFNRQHRRKVVRDEKSLSEMTSQVIINCEEQLTAGQLYKAILESIARHTGEIRIVVKKGEKSHFSVVPLSSIYEGIEQAATQFSAIFNKDLDEQIAQAAMTTEELQAHREAKQQEAHNAHLDYLHAIRKEVSAPDYIARMQEKIDAEIHNLEHTEDVSDEHQKGSNQVS